MLDIIALILIALAILIFLLVHFGASNARTWITTNLGLALFAAAVMLWLAFGAGPVVTPDK